MTAYFISITLLISAILVFRRIFRNKISPRIIYGMWLVVILRLCLPFSVFNMSLTLPELPDAWTVFPDETVSVEQTTAEGTLPADFAPRETYLPTADTETIPVPVMPVLPDEENVTASVQKELPETERIPVPKTEPESEPMREPEYDQEPEFDQESASEPKPIRRLNLRGVALTVWAVGSAAFALWFAVSYLIFCFRIRTGRKYLSEYGNLRVFSSNEAGVPCIFGLIPSIYVHPESVGQNDYALILEHEYTHFRHGDHFWGVLRIVMLTVFWWHPLVWAAAIRSKQDAEFAVDDAVVSALNDEERIRYARSILDHTPVSENLLKKASAAFGGSPVKERVLALTERKNRRFGKFLSAAALVLAAAALTVSTVTVTVVGKSPEPGLSEVGQEETTRRDDSESTEEITEVTTSAPDDSETIPEETTSVPDESETIPEETTAAPEPETTVDKKSPAGESSSIPETTAEPVTTEETEPISSYDTEPQPVEPVTEEEPFDPFADQETIGPEDPLPEPPSGFSGQSGNCRWDYTGAGTLVISGSGKMNNYLIFDTPWRHLMQKIETVIIEDGIESVGICAFYELPNLKVVRIAASVEYIDQYAFCGCTSLSKVTLSEGLCEIRDYGFACCKNLEAITLPDSLLSVGNSAFCKSGIRKIVLPEHLETLGEEAFRGCEKLETVRMGNELTGIRSSTFAFCTALRSVTFSERLTSIGEGAFASSGLEGTVVLPWNLESIGYGAFSGCPNLKTVYIPEKCSFEEYTFYDEEYSAEVITY